MNEIERTPVQKQNPNSKQIMPAERIREVKEYYFSVKLKEVAAMNARGENVINLGIGSPDLPPAEDVVEALCECAQRPDSHGYQPYVGLPELRAAFADFYKRKFGVDLNPDNEILPLMGSKEGIMHISMAFVNHGDYVLVPNPGYPTYSSVSKLVGAEIIYYPLKEENNWLPDFDALEKEHSIGKINLNKVKLMWCNYPNMPTGATADIAVYKRFVEFGKKYGIVICHDNPYSFIRNDKPVSILTVPGAMETCIELNSMSKTFDMPGWRIGMAASNSQFISWILRVKSNMDSGMFKGLQMAAIKALAAPDSWYRKINKLYEERSILAQKVLEAAGCEVRPGQQGLFLWGKVKSSSTATSCNSAAEKLCDKILYECKVFVTPGSVFGSEGRNYVRISLCATKEVLKKALERIKKGMKLY